MRVIITYQRRRDLSYLPLIDMAFQSAKRFNYNTVIVSNRKTIAADDFIFLSEEQEPRLMNWILAAQLAYIESPLFDQPSVFFSPDALILKSLDPVFAKEFDIAFTDRKNPRWPINNGVIYLKPEKKTQIAALWKRALEICKQYPEETQEWYGDQQSLHDTIMSGFHQFLELNVSLLPCEIYNATPMRAGQPVNFGLLDNAYVAHFKGKRKDSMKEYWKILCTKI